MTGCWRVAQTFWGVALMAGAMGLATWAIAHGSFFLLPVDVFTFTIGTVELASSKWPGQREEGR